jgi:hypothetical protein
VAWVRRVRTASGATAVQIAESVGGVVGLCVNVGLARDEAELGLLIEQAHWLLEDERQGVLDLGIMPSTRNFGDARPGRAIGVIRRGSPGPLRRPVVPRAQDILDGVVRRADRRLLVWGSTRSGRRCSGTW